MKVAAAIALTIAVLAAPQLHAAGNFPFSGLPKLSPNQHLEAVAFIEDLRAFRTTLMTQRAYFERARVSKDYFAPEHQKSMYGVDLYAEIDRIVAIAAPKGGPIPVAACITSNGAVLNGQIAIKVEPGVMERIAKDSDIKIVTGDKGDITLDVHGKPVAAKVDGDWLRLGPEADDVASDGTMPPLSAFSDGIARWSKDAQAVFAVIGGGWVTGQLVEASADNPFLQNLVRTAQAFAITVRWDGDMSQIVRLVLDAEAVGQMAPMLRRPDMATSPAAMWDDQALGALAISVPPMALTTALTLAQMQMGNEQDPTLQDLMRAAQSVDGQLSLAEFGAPNDWALAAEFNDDAAANNFVTTLEKSLQVIVDRYGVEKGLVSLAGGKSGGPMLTLRPDVQLPESTVTVFGKSVVVARQRTRVARLAKLVSAKKGKSLLDGPLTPAVREVLARPAIFQAYAVSGYDGALFDWLYWPAKVLEVGLRHVGSDMLAKGGDNPLASPWATGAIAGAKLSRLPLTLALGAYALATSYDYAASLDVDGNDLVLQIAASQL